MDQSSPRDPYRVAFEQAQSLFNELTFELDALDQRYKALLSATKALETMISQRTGEHPASELNSATAVKTQRPAAPTPPLPIRTVEEPLTQVYVHRELPNAIQHRIDLALGPI